MHFKIIFIILIFLFISIFQNSALASDWIQQTIDYTINTKFDSAEQIINDRFAMGDSSLPVYFYYAGILNSKITHYETEQEVDYFYEVLQKIIYRATNVIKYESPENIDTLAKYYFYRGSAYGYLAYSQGKNGQWLKAYDNGMASIDDLEESVRIDSTLYDAYLGIGVYNYWLSTKLKFMLWLPFIPDKRNQGIDNIMLAVSKGLYSSAMGMHQLIYILLDYGHFDEAIPYAEKVIKLYPESQFMRWAHAHVYYKRHEYDKAINSYFMLLELIESDEQSNPSHWLFCQTRLAEIYFKQGQYEYATHRALKALEYQSDKPLKKKEKEKIDQATEILSESREALTKEK